MNEADVKREPVADRRRRDREDPSWTNPTSFAALGFMSASLGLQGIIGVVSSADVRNSGIGVVLLISLHLLFPKQRLNT